MTTRQFIEQQKRRLRELQTENKPFTIGVLATHGMQNQRIFIDGLKVDASKIGIYSTKPIYVNPNNPDVPAKFNTVGKFGNTKFNSGKPHKTRYFPGGYKEFRSVVGRQNEFIDMALSFDLKLDYARPPKRINANRYTAVVTRKNNGDKVKGIEGRKGPVFSGLTQKEINFLVETITIERIKLGL